ncbi:TonB-dependent receptor [Prevotella melaninogenica]
MKKETIYLSLAMLAITNIPCNAQSEEIKDSTLHLEEVTISTTRMPEIKQNAAATVTIIDQKQIAEMSKSAPDITHLLGMLTPGMALSSNTTSSRAQSLRGRSALILIDGIPQSTPLRSTDRDIRTIDIAAIDHIEVVKGSTALYGNGAIGGLINIITKKNTTNRTIAGETTLSGSTYNFFRHGKGQGYRINQQVYGRVGQFDYLVNGAFGRTGSAIDGDGKFISPRYGLGDTYTTNVLVNLGYSLSPKNRIELMYNFYRSLQDTKLIPFGGKYLQSPSIGIIGSKDPQAVDEGTRYNHNAYLKFTSKDIFKHTDLEASVYGSGIYTIFDFRKADPAKPRWEETSGQSAVKDRKFGFRTQFNTRLIFSENAFARLAYGYDYLYNKTSQPLVDGRYWVPWLTSSNHAPFIQVKTTLWEHLNLKLGGRYDFINVNVPDYDVLRNKLSDPQVQVKGGKLKYNNMSFNVGLSYNRYRAFQPFVAYSQGFSIFDLGRTLRAAKADVLSKISTEPVKTNNYEIGVYSDINHWLQLNGSVFYTYSKLGSDLKIENGFWVVNRTPQKVYGVELSADAQILRNLKAGANFSWFEGKLKSATGDWDTYMSNISIPAAKLAMYVNYAPVKNTYLQLQYMHTGKRDRFTPNASGVYNEGEGIVNRINLLNLTAGVKMKVCDLSLAVSNLLNYTYYTPASMMMARNAEYAHADGRKITLTAVFKY